MIDARSRAKLSLHKKDGFKASLMTCTSDTVRTHLQRCRTLGEGLLKLCAHQSPYTGRTHRLFPSPQAASVRPRLEPMVTPPSRVTSRGCYRYANPPPHAVQVIRSRTYTYCKPPYFSEPFIHASYANGLCALIKQARYNYLRLCPSRIYLIRRSSSETREVRTVNKEVEKMQEIGEKWRKCKIIISKFSL